MPHCIQKQCYKCKANETTKWRRCRSDKQKYICNICGLQQDRELVEHSRKTIVPRTKKRSIHVNLDIYKSIPLPHMELILNEHDLTDLISDQQVFAIFQEEEQKNCSVPLTLTDLN